MPAVTGSDSSTTPSVTATTGFRYVMTVIRVGPASATRAYMMRNAAAVHSAPSTTTASQPEVGTEAAGHASASHGA